MSEERTSKDYLVAYEVWTKQADIAQQGSVALLNSSLDSASIQAALKAHLADMTNSAASDTWYSVSYSVLESWGSPEQPLYARHSGWIDWSQAQPASSPLVSAVATLINEGAGLGQFSEEQEVLYDGDGLPQREAALEEAEDILHPDHP